MHLSDLHRSPAYPISNDELISTLIADRERHAREDPKIAFPDALIISGDLVQGVPLGTADSDGILSSQYKVAFDFLAELTDRFVGGDRSRVIIVPGNHDVDWNMARRSMAEVPPAEWPSELGTALTTPGTRMRWSWTERKLYRIADEATYEARLLHYRRTMHRFYEHTTMPVLLDPSGDWSFCELWGGRVAVVAFNSCFDNDMFRLAASIPEEAVARSHIWLHDRGPYELQIAVWHHNISGPPERSDYLDVATVHKLIGKGFRLGLHGHQHRSEAVPHYIHLPEVEVMAVASAGSLCAGGLALPAGVNRQYNMIELDDDLCGARIHVREMAVATVFGPSRMPALGGRSYAVFSWPGPSDALGRKVPVAARRRTAAIEAAEQFFHSHDDDGTLRILGDIDLPIGSYERQLYLNAAERARSWRAIVVTLPQPTSSAELTLLTRALVELGDYQKAYEAITQHGPNLLDPATARELRNWVDAKVALRK